MEMNVPGNNFALLKINVNVKSQKTPQSNRKRRNSILASDEKEEEPAVFVSPSVIGTFICIIFNFRVT